MRQRQRLQQQEQPTEHRTTQQQGDQSCRRRVQEPSQKPIDFFEPMTDRMVTIYRSRLDSIETAVQNFNKPSQQYSDIVNLSSYELSSEEISVLQKGLKFCPTPPIVDPGQIKESLDRFFRSANLYLFFNGTTPSEPLQDDEDLDLSLLQEDNSKKPFEHKDLKPKSTFNPPMPNCLNHVYELILKDLLEFNPPTVKRNLTKGQRKALESLRSNNHIVIKKADKGSNVVIMDTDKYIQEGVRQLGDDKFYVQRDEDLTTEHRLKVQQVLDNMLDNKEITEKTHQYLSSKNERTALLYLLPKIHKNPEHPPGRGIVSGNDCPTEKSSQLLDIILQEAVKKVKSFLKDTSDFLRKLKRLGKLPPQCLDCHC